MSFNTVATPSDTTVATPVQLTRRVGDLEVPAAGMWGVVLASHVGLAVEGHRNPPVRVEIVDGSLRIGKDPEQSEFRLALTGPETMTLVGRPTLVETDHHGMSRWSIAGTVARVGIREPMQLELTYHGVFRSPGRSWAWFSGTGTFGAADRPSRRRRSCGAGRRVVVLDLLLDSPTVLVRYDAARQAA